MNYIMRYDYDNFDEIFECTPSIRHGACFEMLGCTVQFHQISDPCIIFWINGSNITKEQAKEKLKYVCKVLSFVFALSFDSAENMLLEKNGVLQTNNQLSKASVEKLRYIENKILRFNKTKPFFDEMLNLLMVAYKNLYDSHRDEDAFIYFFKVVERISKQHYLQYIQRHDTKAVAKRNKNELRSFLKSYSSDILSVTLTEDMMDRKIDKLYKDLKQSFYGSIFNKISLFLVKNNLRFNLDDVSKVVKIRNKIAHGDVIKGEDLTKYLGLCECLSVQFFSSYFFKKSYEKIHIRSYRFFGCGDFYDM